MTHPDRADDFEERIVGQRYYNKGNDESFTVIDILSQDGTLPFALLQYDDGAAWDEMPSPDMIPSDAAERFGLKEGGIDSAQYIPLGSGPSIERSKELCSQDGHNWTPTPDEVWPDGLPDSATSARLSDLYNRIARCKRCGLSGNAALEFASADELPWFCERCGEVEEDGLSYWVEDWEDLPICSDCEQEVTM